MDKRFQKVIERMEELISKNSQVQKNIEQEFVKVKNVQDEINKKLDTLNYTISQAIGEFKASSLSLHEESENKVNGLINSINDKSKEIFEIHSELDNLRKIQENAKNEFRNIAEDHKKVIEEFKKEQSERFKDSLVGKMGKQINRFIKDRKTK